MGRKINTGLEYFPFETNLFSDIKIRKLIKQQGSKSISVYAYLLCSIYKDGYYIRWDKELPFIISESTGCDEAYIIEVITACLKINLFNGKLFKEKEILTSKGIQERYNHVCKLMKRKNLVSEFSLISSEFSLISSEEMAITSGVKLETSEESAQSKVKESKVKEIKEKCDSILSSQIWIEGVAMHQKKTVQFITDKLASFLTELKLKSDIEKPESEIKSHFVNWIKIEISKINKENSRPGTNSIPNAVI